MAKPRKRTKVEKMSGRNESSQQTKQGILRDQKIKGMGQIQFFLKETKKRVDHLGSVLFFPVFCSLIVQTNVVVDVHQPNKQPHFCVRTGEMFSTYSSMQYPPSFC